MLSCSRYHKTNIERTLQCICNTCCCWDWEFCHLQVTSRKWKTRSGVIIGRLRMEGKLLSLDKLIHYIALICLISSIPTVWDTVLILWVEALFTIFQCFEMFFSSLFFRQRVSDHRQREASHSRPAADSTEVSGPPSSHLLADDPHYRPFRGECFQELLTVGLWTLRNYVMSLWHVFSFNLQPFLHVHRDLSVLKRL